MSLTIIPLSEDQTLGIDMFGFLYRFRKNGTFKALSPAGGMRDAGMHWYVKVDGKKAHYTVEQNKCRFQECMAKRGKVLA